MANYNLRIVRGRTFRWAGTVSTNGVGDDLTGSDMRFNAKHDLRDPDSAIVFTCTKSGSNGITYTTPGSGEFTLEISATKTSTLPATDDEILLKYEIIYTPGTGESWSLMEGDLVVEPRSNA